MFDGYFVKLVSLFYGETMEYEIYDDTNSAEPVMTGTAEYDGDSSRTEGNRAGRLDELLRLQASEDGNLKEKMESYSVRDEMTEKLFDYLSVLKVEVENCRNDYWESTYAMITARSVILTRRHWRRRISG